MGHRDSNLLRTLYVYARKTSEASAQSYFGRYKTADGPVLGEPLAAR